MTFDPWGPLQTVLQDQNDSEFVLAILASAGLPPTRELSEK